MNMMALIGALPGAAAQGLIWGIMAIGVYITFRTLDIADLTVDGTMVIVFLYFICTLVVFLFVSISFLWYHRVICFSIHTFFFSICFLLE